MSRKANHMGNKDFPEICFQLTVRDPAAADLHWCTGGAQKAVTIENPTHALQVG